ncbi:hypothetical protein [Salipiger abyssi]|uniref:Uncharacterized protein n=1 Tax=Salipiger abyssi TaxID=1250539 RepID=A0A1P8UWE4_9RHOB|nr:hypothetical protein [Salipiger abyssi]APZ53715.1 hypothetical protein Ga0080574_TMP3381 [Salipiger abyssi]
MSAVTIQSLLAEIDRITDLRDRARARAASATGPAALVFHAIASDTETRLRALRRRALRRRGGSSPSRRPGTCSGA